MSTLTYPRPQGGKFEFHKLGQGFIDVNETTANVFYIGGPAYVLVTSDDLKLENSSGTQGKGLLLCSCVYKSLFMLTFTGLKFWKIGSRKIDAVKELDLSHLQKGKGKQKRKEIVQMSDSDSDCDFSPPKKRNELKQALGW